MFYQVVTPLSSDHQGLSFNENEINCFFRIKISEICSKIWNPMLHKTFAFSLKRATLAGFA